MAKLILDELTIKVFGGLIIALLVFGMMASLMGAELDRNDNFDKDKVKIEDSDDYGGGGTMWNKIFNTAGNIADGLGSMIKVLSDAPAIIVALIVGVIPLVIAIVIARSFDVGI